MSDVFISYSRKNKDFAKRMIERLNSANKDSWVDWEGIPLSSPNWWAEIKAGIVGGESFVFIISPDSMASVVCNMELDYALDLKKRIIPVVYQDMVSRDTFASIADYQPDEAMKERLQGEDVLAIARDNWQRLSHINWIFFRESDDFNQSFDTLIQTIETDLPYVKAHTRYLARAQEWERENHRGDLLLFGEEIERAETWLQKADGYAQQAQAEKLTVVNPLPQDVHRAYIKTSRQMEQRRRRLARSAQASIAVLALVLVIGLVLSTSIVSQTQTSVDNANTQVANANEALVTATVAQGEAISGQATANALQSTAENKAQIASTQVANAQSTATQIPPTLTQAAIIQNIVGGFANVMINSDNPSDQLARMDELIAQYPDQAQAYLSRGLVYAAQKQFDLASDDYTRAIGIDPQFVEAYNNRGTTRSDQGDLNGAIDDFTQAIAFNPQYAEAYNNRGNARKATGDLDGAIDDYTQALTLNPQYAEAYYNRGVVRDDQGDLDGAIDDYTQALTLNPQLAKAYNGRGNARYAQVDLNSAVADYTQAIAINPQFAEAYNNRGLTRSDQGDVDGAIDDFTQAITINPQYATAYNNRGNFRSAQGDLDRAIDDYTQAITINPQYATAYSNRGFARSAQGDVDGAIDDYNQAISLDPQSAQAYINRGAVYYTLSQGETDKNKVNVYLHQFVADFRQAQALGFVITENVEATLKEVESTLPIPTPTPKP